MTVSHDTFGYLIAYLMPGFILLWGLGASVPVFREGLAVPAAGAPTVGDFLYATVASLAAGLLLSAVRWAVLDRVYHRTGIPEPRWDFGRLAARLPAFEGLVANHYRFYQAYGNSLVAVLAIYGAAVAAGRDRLGPFPATDLLFVGLVVILVLASRDTLRKYYARADQLVRGGRGRGARR